MSFFNLFKLTENLSHHFGNIKKKNELNFIFYKTHGQRDKVMFVIKKVIEMKRSPER